MATAAKVVYNARKQPLVIRGMTEDDLGAVQSIEERVQPHPWRPSHFTNCLETGNLALVVEQGPEHSPSGESRLLAYAIISIGGGEADLLNIAVAPEHQGQGTASCLLEYLLPRITGHADTLFLEVRASNQAAIELYHKLGFNQVGSRPDYYPAERGREDALIFAQALL